MGQPSFIISLALAIAAPLLKWILDTISETFGQKKIAHLKTRIEFHKYLLSITEDAQIKGRITESMNQELNRFLPSVQSPKVKTSPEGISITYGFILHVLTASAITNIVANSILFFLQLETGYARLGTVFFISSIAALVIASKTNFSTMKRILVVLSLSLAIFSIAYVINSMIVNLLSEGDQVELITVP